MTQYWLMKSEPSAFSIDDLMNAANQSTSWDGVRNYQARNYMRQMCLGDKVFFYHSNTKIPGIIGIAEVCKLAHPDLSAQDTASHYHDPKSTADKPIWDMVDIQFIQKLNQLIPLNILQGDQCLQDLPLVRRGNRLSIMPITKPQWTYILSKYS